MLNYRQKRIASELAKTKLPITGKELAEKYSVSIRTIRSDIKEINAFVNKQGASLVSIPGRGMRIVSEDHLKLDEDVLLFSNFSDLNSGEREALIALDFIYHKNSVTMAELSEKAQVSRSMMAYEIKHINEALKSDEVTVEPYSNKGLSLNGTIRQKVKLLLKYIQLLGDEVFIRTLKYKNNGLCEVNFDDSSCISFLNKSLYLYVHKPVTIVAVLRMIVTHAADNKDGYRSSASENTVVDQLIWWLNQKYRVLINKDEKAIIRYVLAISTDYSIDKKAHVDYDYEKIADQLIDYVNNNSPFEVNDREFLKADLIIHLKSSVEAHINGFPRDNPLLTEIKAHYPDQYQAVYAASRNINLSDIKSLFTDDEIGFLTLYFLRNFEKAASVKETNIMVVCNSGRSSSKLITTRLINNIPDIHIVAMCAAIDVMNNNSLDNIDLIISTIPLEHISKPYVVISPLFKEQEIEKVKDAIWMTKREKNYSNLDQQSMAMASEIHDQIATRRMMQEQLELNRTYTDKSVVPIQQAQMLGEITMQIFSLIEKLYPEGVQPNKYSNVSGIFAHILMSVPRWQLGGVLPPAADDEVLINKYVAIDTLDIPVKDCSRVEMPPCNKKTKRSKKGEQNVTQDVFDEFCKYAANYGNYLDDEKKLIYNRDIMIYALRLNRYIGVRPQEVRAITRDCIQFRDLPYKNPETGKIENVEGARIAIDKAVGSTITEEIALRDTKTEESQRWVYLGKEGADLLREILAYSKYDIVFADYDGNLISSTVYSDFMNRVKHKWWKDTGHKEDVYAELMRKALSADNYSHSVSAVVTKQQMGHESENMSANWYATAPDVDVVTAFLNRQYKE